jgi:L-ascorbate metabolism protein UlaG (beta-lactamase superfamily)
VTEPRHAASPAPLPAGRRSPVVRAAGPAAPGAPLPDRVWFLGHATVAIDLDGARVLTDPLLRGRASGLVRRGSAAPGAPAHPIDAVAISHMHQDHLDLPSLRLLGPDTPMVVPRLAGAFLARRGFRRAVEVRPGEAVRVGGVRIVATPARHIGFRPPFGPRGGTLGFVVEGRYRIYFAGDTDLFPQMARLGPIDVALLPVAGWGPTLGPGHMDARRAARALQLIRPKLAIPIHWGTFAPVGLHLRTWSYLVRPPLEFAAYARVAAPEVVVWVLAPGEHVDLATLRVGTAEDTPDAEDLPVEGAPPQTAILPGLFAEADEPRGPASEERP